MRSGGGPRWRTVDSPWRDGTSDCRLRVLFPFLFARFGSARLFRSAFLFWRPSVAETRMDATWRNRLLICILHITISMRSKRHDSIRFRLFSAQKTRSCSDSGNELRCGWPFRWRTIRPINQFARSSGWRIYPDGWWIDNETIRN